MKIAFVVEHLDPSRGGMERSATEFLTEMARLGLDVHAVTQSVSPEFSAAPVHSLGIAPGGRARRYREFVRRADAFVSTGDWDVVHAVSLCLRCDLYQPRAGTVKESMAQSVAHRRSWTAQTLRQWAAWLDPKQRLLRQLERDLLLKRPPRLVAALSSYVQRQIVTGYGLPEKRVRIVFNGVTVQRPGPQEREAVRRRLRQELGLPIDALVGIFVAHNFRRKGLRETLEAMATPEGSGWQLLVIGKDSPRHFEGAAKRLGVFSRIKFLGPRRDVQPLYLAADLLIHPTHYDACARTVLEAVSLGLPSITTANDGAADILRRGQCGVVLESPHDVANLSGALHRFASAEVREHFAERAMNMAPQLTMRRHAEEIAGLYHELAQKGSGE